MENALLKAHPDMIDFEPKINRYVISDESGKTKELWVRDKTTNEWKDMTDIVKKQEAVAKLQKEMEVLKRQLARLEKRGEMA